MSAESVPTGPSNLCCNRNVEAKRYKRVKLHIADISASKIADVNRGILLPISSVQGDFKFALEIDVTTEDGITQSTIDNKIKETIKQIGAQIVDEKLEE